MRFRSHAAWVLSAVLVSATAASAARAQEPPSAADSSREADEQFKQGKALFAEGKKEEAYAAYRKAWELKKSHDIAGNLGNVELELGKARDAAEHLAYCVEHFPTTGAPQQLEKAQQRLAEARKLVGALRIVVTAPEAVVSIDGVVIGKAPLAPEVFVPPGEHTVEAKLAGFTDAKQVVNAAAGSSEPVQLVMAPSEASGATPPPVTPTETAGGPSTPIVVTGIAAGAIGIGAGVVLVILAGGKGSDRDDRLAGLGGSSPCGAGTPFTAECQEIVDLSASQRTLTAVGIGAFAFGGVALGATLIYALASGGSKAEPAQAGLTFTPSLGLSGAGLRLGGLF